MHPDVSPVWPAQCVDSESDETSLTVYGASRRFESRGDTLNTPVLTVTAEAAADDVIGISVVHHAGTIDRAPAVPLEYSPATVSFDSSETMCSMSSGRLQVVFDTGAEWGMRFEAEGRLLTDSGYHNLAYMRRSTAVEPHTGHERAPGRTGVPCPVVSYVVEQLRLGVGEVVYGLGERFTPLVKNGQVIEIWNEDGGTSSELAYKNIPFYYTSRGYGVFVASTGPVSFEVGSEKVSRVGFSVPGERLHYYVIYGPTPAEIMRKYTALTGRPALPPAWSFGLWLSTSFTTDYDEKTVNSMIDGMSERDLPLSVFHFDCFWMRPYRWTDFTWDPDVFPDPEGMLRRLKERGLRICVWINPYIAQRSEAFAEAADAGFLLRTPSGSIRQTDFWQAGMGILDVTNPEARAWYRGKLEALLDMGVDALKTDFGERIPCDVVYHDGSDPLGMHNFYAYRYNELVFDLLRERRGEGDAVLFARSAAAGSQRFPVHWGGDCLATYESMSESLRGGLSLCSSGFAFWSHDIGGFEHTAPADIYKRWVAFGLLSTHSRLHGSESYRVPWNFDDESVDVLRHFTRLKHTLMPYLFAHARSSADTGVPLMRSMPFEFPGDPGCTYLDRQYMLGPALLVAPVFSETGESDFYVPEGEWIDLQSGERFAGPRWYSRRFDYFSLPLLMRPGFLIPRGGREDRPDYDFTEGTTLHCAGLPREGFTMLVDESGKQVAEVSVAERDEGIVVSGIPEHVELVLHGVSEINKVDGQPRLAGGTAERDPSGLRIRPTSDTVTLSL